jgi:signal transduction histidine kinase
MSQTVIGALCALDPKRVIELVASEPVRISCDAELIRRVLENLIGNAIKHTPTSGRVVVAASATPSGARVTVSDEGDGIPEQAKQRIFEKFGTIATRRDRQYHSVGLGLAFCKLAVLAHGGSIGVTSRDPRGSTFWFDLPRGEP